jgi:hypothetical protein
VAHLGEYENPDVHSRCFGGIVDASLGFIDIIAIIIEFSCQSGGTSSFSRLDVGSSMRALIRKLH